MIKSIFISIILLLTVFFAAAQNVDKTDILHIKTQFDTEYNLTDANFEEIFLISESDTLATIYSYKNAFVIISNKKQLPPIKSYSLENSFPKKELYKKETGISFEEIIIDDYLHFLKNTNKSSKGNSFKNENENEWQRILSEGIKETKQQYGPWLNNIYGQVNCKNENGYTVNVTNYYTPSNYAAGCVAITFTSLLQYHNWPRIGVGSHTYTDNYGSTKGSHSVNYEKKYYNWSLILDEYHTKATTSRERSELGNLTYHCAVAIDMDFEYNGSTSNINRIPAAANKYFRYTAKHLKKSASNFWSSIDQNLKDSLPVQFAIYTSAGAGHAIVCDGLKPSTKYYHLNMGWWGTSNAWYKIQDGFNAGGYSNITAAVVDMIPNPEMATPKLDFDNEAVDVNWYYPQSVKVEAFELQVKVGIANYVTINDSIKATSYKYKYKNTEIHTFKVRAKVNGKWIDNSYSNYKSINIKSELSTALPEELKVYPTVCTNVLNIESKYLKGGKIEIYNTSGQLVFETNVSSDFSSSKYTLNTNFLRNGLYILRVSNNDYSESKHIVKI